MQNFNEQYIWLMYFQMLDVKKVSQGFSAWNKRCDRRERKWLELL